MADDADDSREDIARLFVSLLPSARGFGWGSRRVTDIRGDHQCPTCGRPFASD